MFKEEGYKLMGAAFEVYNQLGYGMASATKANCNGNASSCPTCIRFWHKHEVWNANLH